MASPQMRVHSDAPEQAGKSRRSALRLLGIERTEEIFPVLLEEIVALGILVRSLPRSTLKARRSLLSPLSTAPKLCCSAFRLPFSHSRTPWLVSSIRLSRS